MSPADVYRNYDHFSYNFWQASLPIGTNPYEITMADVDNNGTLDLCVNLRAQSEPLIGNGNGTFQQAHLSNRRQLHLPFRSII